MEIVVRRVRADDFDTLFGLVERFASSFRAERSAFEAVARVLVDRDEVWLGGAEGSGGLVGYCLGFDHLTFYANGRVAWVEEIMVDESCRRQGIGHALMNGFEEWARSRGAKLVGLATRRAAPFYDALEYEASATYFRKIL
jgi:GNAT superfamily N-acetyltransferase